MPADFDDFFDVAEAPGPALTLREIGEVWRRSRGIKTPLKVDLSLPWPPTVNTYWRAFQAVKKNGQVARGKNGKPIPPRMIISKEGRVYRKRIVALIASLRLPLVFSAEDRLTVEIAAHVPDRRERDLDNILKCLLDSLKHAGVYPSDGQVDRLVVDRSPKEKGGRVGVTITERAPQ